MSRRVLARSGRPAASTNVALPEYQPQSCPLNDFARKALGELSRNRGTAAYETQLKESVRHLGHSVGDLNERLLIRKERLLQLRRQRQEKGTEKLPEEERLESHLPNFQTQVEKFTVESEKALRQIIDQRAELEDEAAVLGDLYTSGETTDNLPRRRRRGDDGQDEEDADIKEAIVPCLVDTFKKLRSEKRSEYNRMSPHQRYALQNDYAGFKKLWHDAAVGEDGPPLPDASKWFLPNGEPAMSTSSHGRKRRSAGDGNDVDEDDQDIEEDEEEEIAIQREKVSMKCPLTLLPMVEPYKNNKCPHVVEKSAMLDYLSSQVEKQCPETGCSQTFSRDRFEQEFCLDEAMIRRIKRDRQAQEARRDMDDNEDVDETDYSLAIDGERQTGNGIPPKRIEKDGED